MTTHDSQLERDLERQATASFTSNLDSITLYGSYVRGTFRPRTSDVNVLVLLRAADGTQIRDFGIEAKRLLKAHRITPLIMTTDEFLNSADVFPLEYADIADAHRTIHGEDPTARLVLTNAHLRHQLEHLLRGNLITLRQIILNAGTNLGELRAELGGWFAAMTVVFRGLLRLAAPAEPIPESIEQQIDRANTLFGFDAGPFRTLAALRVDSKAAKAADFAALALEAEARLTAFAASVDRFERSAGNSEVE